MDSGYKKQEERKRTVQIFVKVDGMNTVLREVSLEDKVQKILNAVSGSDQDVYVTCEGRMLRTEDQLKSCGVRDGSTIQVMSRMRGGGKHEDKKSKVEKKQVTRQEPLKSEGPAILESDKDAVIRMSEENEDHRKLVEDVSGGSDIEVERKMQHWATALQARAGLDKGQMRVMGGGSKEKRKARRARAKWAARGRATATGRSTDKGEQGEFRTVGK